MVHLCVTRKVLPIGNWCVLIFKLNFKHISNIMSLVVRDGRDFDNKTKQKFVRGNFPLNDKQEGKF